MGSTLVGGQRQVTGAVELADDGHLRTIQKRRAYPADGVPGTPALSGDQLQDTVMVNGLLIIPAIGFFMSAPDASPVMV